MCHHRGYDYLAERLGEEEHEESPIEDAPADEFDIEELDGDDRERVPLIPPADDSGPSFFSTPRKRRCPNAVLPPMGDTEGDQERVSQSDEEAASEIGREVLEDPSSMFTLLGHFYRGEMDRVTTWRGRLDQTTYWAVTIVAAVLTWAFSSPDNPHYTILIGMVTVLVFLYFETRRYRAYDVWRSRVRLLEEDFFATTFDPDAEVVHPDWRAELSKDLRQPALKVGLLEAVSRRLRRVYLGLLAILLAAWLVRVTSFEPDQTIFESAAIPGVPGNLVVAGVAGFFLIALAVAFWPLDRQAMGEFHERDAAGEWKDE